MAAHPLSAACPPDSHATISERTAAAKTRARAHHPGILEPDHWRPAEERKLDADHAASSSIGASIRSRFALTYV